MVLLCKLSVSVKPVNKIGPRLPIQNKNLKEGLDRSF